MLEKQRKEAIEAKTSGSAEGSGDKTEVSSEGIEEKQRKRIEEHNKNVEALYLQELSIVECRLILRYVQHHYA